MKTNKWILGGLMAMAITACTSDELVENTNPTQGRKVTVTAYAPGDEANSRVSFADDNTSTVTLSWKEGDKFSVVCGTNVETFSKTAKDNTFSGDLPASATSPASYYAFYPALEEEEEEATLTAENTVPFDLSTQTGALDESKTYMRAESKNGLTYSFQHCTAILKATFANIPANTKISQVVVKTSHADSKVDGNLNLTTGTISDGSKNTITINYATAVDASTPVYIYLPPMAADKKGLTFTVTTEDEKQYTGTLAGSNDNGIVAGMVYKAEVAVRAVTRYLTFTAAAGDQTLKINTAVSGLQYSTDGEIWTNLGTNPVNFNGNKQLFLRGQNPSGTNTANISFGNPTVNVACSGDIRTLVDYTNYTTITEVGNAKFKYLFQNCTVLTSAPELPFATLASNCYYSMFEGCTSLLEAPELPATTLAEGCYEEMFVGCTSLVTAPELPATTLAARCYERMFEGCTSLVSAPELPATTLAARCYQYMFAACTSLVTAPELPATTLAERCYSYMFGYCTSLVTAPELPATTLTVKCYSYMFSNCTSLKTSPVLSPVKVNSNSLSYMFYYCENLKEITWLADGNLLNNDNSDCWVLYVAPTGSFYKLKDKYVTRGSDACPSGWTVVDYEEQEK